MNLGRDVKMKTLVTYYSRTGNTKKVAEEMAKLLNADIDHIVDKTDRKGAKGWLLSGRDATKKHKTEIKYEKDPKSYDLVVIGTPIWAFTVTPAIRTYLHDNAKKLKKVAFFTTSGGMGIENTFEEMAKLSKKPIATLGLKLKTWSARLHLEKDSTETKIKEFCKAITKQ
jgi:flavodoxin